MSPSTAPSPALVRIAESLLARKTILLLDTPQLLNHLFLPLSILVLPSRQLHLVQSPAPAVIVFLYLLKSISANSPTTQARVILARTQLVILSFLASLAIIGRPTSIADMPSSSTLKPIPRTASHTAGVVSKDQLKHVKMHVMRNTVLAPALTLKVAKTMTRISPSSSTHSSSATDTMVVITSTRLRRSARINVLTVIRLTVACQ